MPSRRRAWRRLAGMSDEGRSAMGLRSAETIAAYSPRNFGLQIASIAATRGDGLAAPANAEPKAAG